MNKTYENEKCGEFRNKYKQDHRIKYDHRAKQGQRMKKNDDYELYSNFIDLFDMEVFL